MCYKVISIRNYVRFRWKDYREMCWSKTSTAFQKREYGPVGQDNAQYFNTALIVDFHLERNSSVTGHRVSNVRAVSISSFQGFFSYARVISASIESIAVARSSLSLEL
jgi:hypothetical protein